MSKQVNKIKAMIKNNESKSKNASNPSKYHFKNLVFEGGGVKGIAYVGALEKLDEEGILKDIERVAGTSAGAMLAVLVGLGYTAKEIGDILWEINFQNFMDSSWGGYSRHETFHHGLRLVQRRLLPQSYGRLHREKDRQRRNHFPRAR